MQWDNYYIESLVVNKTSTEKTNISSFEDTISIDKKNIILSSFKLVFSLHLR